MQPCPATARETFTVDTTKLPDGTYPLVATATDAAEQPATSTATLRIDQHAPTAPQNLKAALADDGSYVLTWTNPSQGTAAPIVRAHYQVCDALGLACTIGTATELQRANGVGIPAGDHQVRVWLEDEAGHADPAAAAVVHVNSSTGAHVVDTHPPVLLPSGSGASPQLRVTRARRDGSTLVLSGTIAKRASARIAAQLSRSKGGRPAATARVTPRNGRWTMRVKLGPTMQRSTAIYLTLRFAGQGDRYKKATLQRRLTRKPRRHGSTVVEFDLKNS